MTLENLGNIGELVGAVGVIASLLYMASQIRQSTTLSRVQARESVVDSWHGWHHPLAENAELASIWTRGLSAFDSLSPEEQTRFVAQLAPFVAHFEKTLKYHESGLVDRDLFEAIEANLAGFLLSPGGRAVWQRLSPRITENGRRHIEEVLANPSARVKGAEEAILPSSS